MLSISVSSFICKSLDFIHLLEIVSCWGWFSFDDYHFCRLTKCVDSLGIKILPFSLQHTDSGIIQSGVKVSNSYRQQQKYVFNNWMCALYVLWLVIMMTRPQRVMSHTKRYALSVHSFVYSLSIHSDSVNKQFHLEFDFYFFVLITNRRYCISIHMFLHIQWFISLVFVFVHIWLEKLFVK